MSSRYANTEVLTYTTPTGSTVTYLARRFPDPDAPEQVSGRTRVAPGDRPDLLAYRVLHDPEAYWRLADCNHVLSPDELTHTPGAFVSLPRGTP